MPQVDRYKPRTVAIEFMPYEDFHDLPRLERNVIVLVTNGQITLTLNEQLLTIIAPAILCLNATDRITIHDQQALAAQAFAFHPDFLKVAPLVSSGADYALTLTLQTGNRLCQASKVNERVFALTTHSYYLIFNWFSILGIEVLAQSDSLWVCRIKQQLIQIFTILENLFRDKSNNPLDLALDYIYLHYAEPLTLDQIIQAAHANRNTLNALFKHNYGVSVMVFVSNYRIKIAKVMLVHTGMSITEIAATVGFNYDTYFMRKFMQVEGQSPTDYRKSTRIVSREV